MSLTTATLLGVVEKRKPFAAVFKSLFFAQRAFFSTDKIDLDKVTRRVKRAAFVSPIVAGQPQRKEGFSTLSVYPAYLKPLDAIAASDLTKRLPGEAYDAPLTAAERRDAVAGQLAVEQDMSIEVAEEWLCVQVAKFGKVTIESEHYPKSEIDYGRNANNTITLATGAKWTDVDKATYPLNEKFTEYMSRASSPVTAVFMNQNTYAKMVGFADIGKLLDTRRGSVTSLETAAFNGQHFVKMGNLGIVEVWVYTGTFEDDKGATKLFFEDGELLFGPGRADGTMAYGMIHDPKANYQPLERFPKEFTEDNPAGDFVMTQSAPLPVPGGPDDFVYLKAY